MRNIEAEQIAKYNHKYNHIQQRIKHRPSHTQVRALVSRLEICVDHSLENKAIFYQTDNFIDKRIDQLSGIIHNLLLGLIQILLYFIFYHQHL